jgi:hypothetical protein
VTTAPAPPTGPVTGQIPPGAVGPVESDQGDAAGEAAPEAAPEGPETGKLSGVDEEEVTQSFRLYVYALDRHDARLACSLFAPGALRLSELPVRRDGCAGSMRASIGFPPRGGGPAWKRTEIVEIRAASVEGGGARVTATVTHHFSDRKYVSVEDDVVYLEKTGAQWRLAKPSATFYRAIGYRDPPLEAFQPPAD